MEISPSLYTYPTLQKFPTQKIIPSSAFINTKVCLFGCHLNWFKLFRKHLLSVYLFCLQAGELILLCFISSTFSSHPSPVPKHFTQVWCAKFLHSDRAHKLPKKVSGIQKNINTAIKLLFYGLQHRLCFSKKQKKPMQHRREHIKNKNSSSRCFCFRSL